MSPFTVTIRDITAWTTTIRARDAIHAESQAWELFQSAGDRSEHLEVDDNTTVQVEEVLP
ncbi:MAG: hypothetical protein AB7O57_16935 [Hyphomicrobiaceae bacterium]